MQRPGPGYFVEPTIVVPAHNHHRIMREEVFGAVGSVLPFDGLAQAVAYASDIGYGFAATVWTRYISKAHIAVAGMIGIDCHSALDDALPSGGCQQSGSGRDGGRRGVEEFTEQKTVVTALRNRAQGAAGGHERYGSDERAR